MSPPARLLSPRRTRTNPARSPRRPHSEVTSPIAEKKKKRKLGGAKRVLTEEEILQFQDQSLRGGAVPRLVKGGF